MNLYRCYFCNYPTGLEFPADKPECPTCRKTRPFVVNLVTVHWLVPTPGGPIPPSVHPHSTSWEEHAVACDPGRKNLTGIAATGQPDAVTCPKCKAAVEFDKAIAKFREENGVQT